MYYFSLKQFNYRSASLFFQISVKLAMDQRCSHHILLCQVAQSSHAPLVPRMFFLIRSASNAELFGLRSGDGMQQDISFAAHVGKTAYSRRQMSLVPTGLVDCYILQDFITRQWAALHPTVPQQSIKDYSIWSL